MICSPGEYLQAHLPLPQQQVLISSLIHVPGANWLQTFHYAPRCMPSLLTPYTNLCDATTSKGLETEKISIILSKTISIQENTFSYLLTCRARERQFPRDLGICYSKTFCANQLWHSNSIVFQKFTPIPTFLISPVSLLKMSRSASEWYTFIAQNPTGSCVF